MGVEVPFVYQVVPASRVEVPREGMYRYENMPMLALDLLFPVRSRGDVYVVVWHEDAIGAMQVDNVQGLLTAPLTQRYPVPHGWLRKDQVWLQSVYVPSSESRPLFVLDMAAMLTHIQMLTMQGNV